MEKICQPWMLTVSVMCLIIGIDLTYGLAHAVDRKNIQCIVTHRPFICISRTTYFATLAVGRVQNIARVLHRVLNVGLLCVCHPC